MREVRIWGWWGRAALAVVLTCTLRIVLWADSYEWVPTRISHAMDLAAASAPVLVVFFLVSLALDNANNRRHADRAD